MSRPIPENFDVDSNYIWGGIQDWDCFRPQMPPDRALELKLIGRELAKEMYSLTAREREVLEMRFGRKEASLREIGRFLGVSAERIRQIEAKALRKMRHPERSKRIEKMLWWYDDEAKERRRRELIQREIEEDRRWLKDREERDRQDKENFEKMRRLVNERKERSTADREMKRQQIEAVIEATRKNSQFKIALHAMAAARFHMLPCHCVGTDVLHRCEGIVPATHIAGHDSDDNDGMAIAWSCERCGAVRASGYCSRDMSVVHRPKPPGGPRPKGFIPAKVGCLVDVRLDVMRRRAKERKARDGAV